MLTRHLKIYLTTFLLGITAAIPADLFVASMPAISRTLNGQIHVIQLTMTLFILGFSLGQFFYGPWSDYCGRRKAILFSLGIGIVGSVICALAQNIVALILGRLLQGIGASGSLAIPRAIYRDIDSGDSMSRSISYLTAIVEVFIAVSPFLGGLVVQHFGWRFNFYILAIINIVAFLFVGFIFPETNLFLKKGKMKIRNVFLSYGKNFNARLLFYVFCGCAGFTNLMLYFTITPFIFQNYFHLSSEYYGLLTVMISFALIIGAIFNSKTVNILRINGIIFIASLLSFFSGFVLWIDVLFYQPSLLIIMTGSFVMVFSSALLFPNGIAGALKSASQDIGITSALYGGLQILLSFAIIQIITQYTKINYFEKLCLMPMAFGAGLFFCLVLKFFVEKRTKLAFL